MYKIGKYKFYIVGLSVFISLFSVSSVRSAELYFGSQSKEYGPNSEFAVGLFINTEGENVNALEGKILFPADFLEFKEIYSGDSIINFWIENPSASCENMCEVVFSGIVPGGYIGERGHIFSFVVKAKKLGDISITTADDRVLLNDGLGTETNLKHSPIVIKISEEAETSIFEAPYDINPPESFLPSIEQNTEIFNNKLFLVFATQDKLSGVDHYEVAEKRGVEIEDYDELDWKVAKSPYLLKDQKLISYIYIKAVDKSENSRIQIILPQNKISLFRKYGIYAILLVIIPFIFWRILWRKKD